MSNVKLQASASGTGTVTIAPPVTNSDLTINLPANSGTVPTIASVVNNGVVYTNSTGAITSSSALTFDGTNYLNVTGLRIGGSDTTNTIYQATGALALSTGSTSSIIFNVNLSEGMRLTTTGLGIGTNSPVGKLDVRGASYVDTDYGYFRANNALQRLRIGTDGSNDIYLPGAAPLTISGQAGVAFSTALTERMRLDSSGNLGIGTSSPAAKLGVAGNAIFSGATPYISLAYNQSGSTPNYWELSAGGVATLYNIGTGTNGQWRFVGGAGSEFMRLDSSGNLGLGVTPSAWAGSKALQLPWGSIASGYNYSVEVASLAYRDNANWRYQFSGQLVTLYEGISGQHRWFTAPSGTAGNAISFTQAMTLDASGDWYLGGTTTSTNTGNRGRTASVIATANNSVLTIESTGTTANANYAIIDFVNRSQSSGDSRYAEIFAGRSNTSTTALDGYMAFATTSGGVAGERCRITSGGDLLVGTSSTYYGEKFTVSQGAADKNTSVERNTTSTPYGSYIEFSAAAPNNIQRYFLQCIDNVAERMTVRSNGGIANYSANNVNLSDRREKTNFAPAKDYLDTICAMPVQTFNYIDQSEDDPGLTLGVVAQDVQAVAPELVMESNWGTKENPKMRLSIYQTDLQYALMKALQELNAKVESLTTELNALKGT